MSCIRDKIAAGAALIDRLEPIVAQAKLESMAAAHDLRVQLRYAQRLANVALKPNTFEVAMVALIDADKAAINTIGQREGHSD